MNEYDEELRSIAVKLKVFCDKSGKEIDYSKSAKIIHKIGRLHLKLSPDKISLIKAVGLFNSAIARKPDNVSEIEEDLSEICQRILKIANARDQTANLIEQAYYVKSQIELMREKTNRSLREIKDLSFFEKTISNSNATSQQLHKIKAMKRIQREITTHYEEIMKQLCQYCVDVMGPPPCKFAVVGMESLSRKEITPYSDFEHIILLEIRENYENCLEYFRWFSVIFHVIILNLQETIIPSYLNDKTCDLGDWFFDTYTSGVSFDGMMPHACKFPLGRTQPTENKPWKTELIKPVDQMLEYLSSEEDLKNGYHLSHILMETWFVYGDQFLHFDFQNGIKTYKNSKKRSEIIREMKNQVQEDMESFGTRIRIANLNPNKILNIKQLFYRTSTLFIAAIGKYCSIPFSSCFDIINELSEQNLLTEYARVKFSLAVAIACEIRLRVYMNAKSQRDYITPCENAKTIFDDILKIINIDSIISYFQITYCLQLAIIGLLKIKTEHLYSGVGLLNIAICHT